MRHLFDVRNIIGALLGIYGVVLTIAGFAPGLLGDHHSAATDNPVDLYVGTDANWWVGLALIGVSVLDLPQAVARHLQIQRPRQNHLVGPHPARPTPPHQRPRAPVPGPLPNGAILIPACRSRCRHALVLPARKSLSGRTVDQQNIGTGLRPAHTGATLSCAAPSAAPGPSGPAFIYPALP